MGEMVNFRTIVCTGISKMGVEGLEAYGICKGSQNLQPLVPERKAGNNKGVRISAEMNRTRA